MKGRLAAGCRDLLVRAPLAAARQAVLRGLSALSPDAFACRVEQLASQGPAGRDQFFHVQMIGRIPVPRDNYPTDVRVEINDITDGTASSDPVLSTDPQFQSASAIFRWQTCNGSVPRRNAVLARWITAAQIPCHVLRFACRGRRRLLFCVSILSAETGLELTRARHKLDYVNCTDGYRERLERKMEVFKSTLRLAAMSGIEEDQLASSAAELMRRWLQDKTTALPTASKLNAILAEIESEAPAMNLALAADRLLAWGDQSDKESAVLLSLQSAACRPHIGRRRFGLLTQMARMLGVHEDFFLAQAQQCFLGAGCEMEDALALLGIDSTLQTDQIIRLLTDLYRKWNARVTHPDADIRQQADRILSLIADLRSRQLSTTH